MEKELKIKASLRKKIVLAFSLIVLVTIIVFEIFSIVSIRYYYYSSLRGIMTNELRYATSLYTSYMSDYQLKDIVLEDKNQFYRQAESQVQILDNSGVVLYDSRGSFELSKKITTSDVMTAKADGVGYYNGKDVETKQGIMSVAAPLKSRGTPVGIVRYIASTTSIDRSVYRKTISFVFFGFAVMMLSIFLAMIIARQIVRPIEDLTRVAIKYADGNYKEKAKMNDYDELGKLGKVLNLLTENIVKKEKIKNEFISSISHELRTPLTSISGWAQTCSYDPKDTEIVKEGLSIIEEESIRLSDMVEELLDFSRLTSGRIDITPKPYNLILIAKDVVRQLSPRAKTDQIDLIINYDQEELIAHIDPKRIKQVFINVIDNSIKFTERGGTIVVDIREEDTEMVVRIVDTGVGISAEEIDLVTGKFYKGSNSNSHTGLGLSICEEIIKLHKGSMMIESEINKGTTVIFKLPKGGLHD